MKMHENAIKEYPQSVEDESSKEFKTSSLNSFSSHSFQESNLHSDISTDSHNILKSMLSGK